MAKKLELQLVRSTICTPQWMRVIVRTLALRKMQQKVVVNDSKSIRGMVARVPHLVSMKEIEG